MVRWFRNVRVCCHVSWLALLRVPVMSSMFDFVRRCRWRALMCLLSELRALQGCMQGHDGQTQMSRVLARSLICCSSGSFVFACHLQACKVL